MNGRVLISWLAALLWLALLPGCASRNAEPLAAEAGAEAAPLSDSELERRAEANAHYAAALVHESNGDQAAAIEEFQKAALAFPEDEKMVLDATLRLLRLQKMDQALEVIRGSALRKDASVEVLVRYAFIAAQAGKLDEAITANRRAVREVPGNFAALQSLYLNLIQAKRFSEADSTLDRAARLKSVTPEFLINLSELYLNLSANAPRYKSASQKQALALLRRALASPELKPREKLRIADGFFVLNDSEASARLYEDLLPEFEGSTRVRSGLHFKLAQIALQNGQRSNAVEQLTLITKEDPSNAQVFYVLGGLATEDRDWDSAIAHYEKSVLLNANFQPAFYELAAAQLAAGLPDDAVKTISQASLIFPASFSLAYVKAMALVAKKEYGQAIEMFTEAELLAQAAEPQRLNSGFYFQFAAAHERNGDLRQAEKLFHQCLELDPDSHEALNYLGYTWADRGEKLDQAYDYIVRALKYEPDNAAYLDSMAWVLYKQEKLHEALKYMLKAVEKIEEPDATLYDHLGDIYRDLKQPDKAREAWRKSVEIEPNDAVKGKLDNR